MLRVRVRSAAHASVARPGGALRRIVLFDSSSSCVLQRAPIGTNSIAALQNIGINASATFGGKPVKRTKGGLGGPSGAHAADANTPSHTTSNARLGDVTRPSPEVTFTSAGAGVMGSGVTGSSSSKRSKHGKLRPAQAPGRAQAASSSTGASTTGAAAGGIDHTDAEAAAARTVVQEMYRAARAHAPHTVQGLRDPSAAATTTGASGEEGLASGGAYSVFESSTTSAMSERVLVELDSAAADEFGLVRSQGTSIEQAAEAAMRQQKERSKAALMSSSVYVRDHQFNPTVDLDAAEMRTGMEAEADEGLEADRLGFYPPDSETDASELIDASRARRVSARANSTDSSGIVDFGQPAYVPSISRAGVAELEAVATPAQAAAAEAGRYFIDETDMSLGYTSSALPTAGAMASETTSGRRPEDILYQMRTDVTAPSAFEMSAGEASKSTMETVSSAAQAVGQRIKSAVTSAAASTGSAPTGASGDWGQPILPPERMTTLSDGMHLNAKEVAAAEAGRFFIEPDNAGTSTAAAASGGSVEKMKMAMPERMKMQLPPEVDQAIRRAEAIWETDGGREGKKLQLDPRGDVMAEYQSDVDTFIDRAESLEVLHWTEAEAAAVEGAYGPAQPRIDFNRLSQPGVLTPSEGAAYEEFGSIEPATIADSSLTSSQWEQVKGQVQQAEAEVARQLSSQLRSDIEFGGGRDRVTQPVRPSGAGAVSSAHDAADMLKAAAAPLVERARHAAEVLVERVGGSPVVERAKDVASEVVDRARPLVDEAKEAAADSMKEAKPMVTEAVEAAKEAGGKAAGKVKEWTAGVTSTAGVPYTDVYMDAPLPPDAVSHHEYHRPELLRKLEHVEETVIGVPLKGYHHLQERIKLATGHGTAEENPVEVTSAVPHVSGKHGIVEKVLESTEAAAAAEVAASAGEAIGSAAGAAAGTVDRYTKAAAMATKGECWYMHILHICIQSSAP